MVYHSNTMFFAVLIILLFWFRQTSPHMPADGLWFMLSIFAGLAYVAGFLDSRLFARFDQKRTVLPDDADTQSDV